MTDDELSELANAALPIGVVALAVLTLVIVLLVAPVILSGVA